MGKECYVDVDGRKYRKYLRKPKWRSKKRRDDEVATIFNCRNEKEKKEMVETEED